jgi:uncharacterized protein YjbI with pentapeptide repeats
VVDGLVILEIVVINKLTHGRYKDNALVENQNFENVDFESFTINPVDGVEVKFRNCNFINCKITKGGFQLGKNVTLENVLFNNIEVEGDLDFHSGAKIRNSKVTSTNENDILWIKNILSDAGCTDNRVELDISEFDGEIIITGNDVSGVTLNPNKHCFIKKSLLEQNVFKLTRSNFFRASASKVKTNGSEMGVFSYAFEDISSDEFKEQFETFKSLGYVLLEQ